MLDISTKNDGNVKLTAQNDIQSSILHSFGVTLANKINGFGKQSRISNKTKMKSRDPQEKQGFILKAEKNK